MICSFSQRLRTIIANKQTLSYCLKIGCFWDYVAIFCPGFNRTNTRFYAKKIMPQYMLFWSCLEADKPDLTRILLKYLNKNWPPKPLLQAVVDFMYQGKVNVMQKELDSFLALSRELQVKGLNQELPEENSVEEMEPKDCLKLRKSEDLFKSKELGSNPKEEDERSVCNLDMVNKIRMSGWDSNANEEHGKDHREKKEYQEDKRSGELQYEMELYQEAVAQRLYQEAQRNMLTSTAECGLVGFGGQAGRRNFEENRGDDVELGYPVGYHVGNLCSGWNWGKCKFGIKCKWQHRCSKMMPDGVICKDQWHTERQHI